MGSSQSSHADPLASSSASKKAGSKSGIMRVGGRKAANNKKDNNSKASVAPPVGGKKGAQGASFATSIDDGGSAPHGLVGSFVSEPTEAFLLHPTEEFSGEVGVEDDTKTKKAIEPKMVAFEEEEDPVFEEDEDHGAILVPSDVSSAGTGDEVLSGEEDEDEDEDEDEGAWEEKRRGGRQRNWDRRRISRTGCCCGAFDPGALEPKSLEMRPSPNLSSLYRCSFPSRSSVSFASLCLFASWQTTMTTARRGRSASVSSRRPAA
jgi:hypothetical protein